MSNSNKNNKRPLSTTSSSTFCDKNEENSTNGNTEMNPSKDLEKDGPFLLRIRRRRRGERTACTLRMELDAASMLASVQLIQEEKEDKDNKKHPKNCVIWKRVELNNHPNLNENNNNKHSNKRRRIVDAVLVENENIATTTTSNTNAPNSNKRRKLLTLQLLEPSTSTHTAAKDKIPYHSNHSRRQQPQQHCHKQLQQQQQVKATTTMKKKAAYPILSPQKRIVDDSLHQLLQGNISVTEHCALLHQQQTQLANNINNNIHDQDPSGCFWPWTYCDSYQHNNWLHACAFWNQGTIANEVLQQLRQYHFVQQQPVAEATAEAKETKELESWTVLLRCMLTASNADGYTPLQLAQHLRHEATVHVLESYESQISGKNTTTSIGSRMEKEEEDWDKKKHPSQDPYGPEDTGVKNDDDWMDCPYEYDLYRMVEPGAMTECRSDDNDERILDCELHDRCTGYFDQYGELVLEPATHHHSSHAFHNDDDEWDSNDEDCFANDYPDDEQDDDVDWSSQCSDGSSSNAFGNVDTTFRRRPFVVSREDDEYDAAYGICDQRDIEYDDECE